MTYVYVYWINTWKQGEPSFQINKKELQILTNDTINHDK